MSLEDLLNRLEAAKEGSRELDAEIHLLIDPDWLSDAPQLRGVTEPYYTTSLDAILTLVPKGWTYEIMKSYCTLYLDGDTAVEAHAPTPALAMCIAIMKALKAQAA